MMHALDPVCFDALDRLLSRPDPIDLPPRTHVRRCEGDPDRRATRLPGILMAWLQQRHLGVDIEEPFGKVTRAALVHEPFADSSPKRPSMQPLRFRSPRRSPTTAAAAHADSDRGSDLMTARAV